MILLGCVTLTTVIASAENSTPPERIRFKKHQHSAVLTGSLTGREPKRYVVGGEADQQITVHLTSSDHAARFVLSEFGGSSADGMTLAQGTDWVGTLPELADYTIDVSSETNATTFTLQVSLSE